MVSPIDQLLRQLKNKVEEMMNSINGYSTLSFEKSDQDTFDLKKIFNEILQHEEWVSQISARSYKHDNGFIKLVLEQYDGLISETRIHIWPKLPEGTKFDENIHDHSAHFASLVLKGGLKEEFYECSEFSPSAIRNIKVKEFSCGSRGEKHNYIMDYQGIRELSLYSVNIVAEGHWHVLGNRILHRTYPMTVPTITLFFQSIRKSYGTHVYSSLERDWDKLVSSTPLSEEETTYWLKKAINL